MPSTLVLFRYFIATLLTLAFLVFSNISYVHHHDSVHEYHAHSCETSHDEHHHHGKVSSSQELKINKTLGVSLSMEIEHSPCDLCLLFLFKQPQKHNDSMGYILSDKPIEGTKEQWENDKRVQLETLSPYHARAGPKNV